MNWDDYRERAYARDLTAFACTGALHALVWCGDVTTPTAQRCVRDFDHADFMLSVEAGVYDIETGRLIEE